MPDKKAEKSLQDRYLELQDIHNKALHELADAAQIIKSYEYLEKRSRTERALFEQVLSSASQLCESENFEVFEKNRRSLIRAIRDYRAHISDDSNGKSQPKPPPPHFSTISQ